jgi:hypothetical protein
VILDERPSSDIRETVFSFTPSYEVFAIREASVEDAEEVFQGLGVAFRKG